MAGRLDGKVAIVTGSGRGIGEALARSMHAEGATVIVADITGGENAVASQLGERATPVRADVTDEAAVKAMVDETVDRHGRLDVLCNNAGIDGEVGAVADCTALNFDRVVAVNLRGVFLGMKYGIPALLESGGGSIINIASVAGLVGAGGLPAYCASKAGVIGLTRAAAVEYAKAGLRANALCPGVIRTPMLDAIESASPQEFSQIIGKAEAMTAIGRIGNPAEIGAVAVFLASDESSFVTGTALPVDGGYTAW